MSPSKSTKEPTKSSKVPSDVAMMPVERKTQHSGPTTGDEMFSKMDAFRKEFEENAKKMHKSSMTFNQTQVLLSDNELDKFQWNNQMLTIMYIDAKPSPYS